MLKTCINCCLADRRLIISLLAGAAFPRHHESPAGRRRGAGEGLWPAGWVRLWQAGTGGSGQALPAAGSTRSSPPSLPGAGGLEEPPRRREALAQPRSVFTPPFNLSMPDAERELTGSSMCTGSGHEHPWGTGGSPHPATPQQAARFCSQGSRGCQGEKSQSKKVLYLPPQQRSAFGKDGASIGSDCPVRASEPQDSSHHPFLTHSAASLPASLLRLVPSIIHAPHCSLCTLGCCHRLSHALAGKLQPPSQRAGSGAGHGSRAVRRSCPASSRHRVLAISPRLGRAADGGWKERCPGSPGRCPAPFPHTPVIILSITFINTLHSAGFFHTSWWEFSMRCVFPAAVRAVIQCNYI